MRPRALSRVVPRYRLLTIHNSLPSSAPFVVSHICRRYVRLWISLLESDASAPSAATDRPGEELQQKAAASSAAKDLEELIAIRVRLGSARHRNALHSAWGWNIAVAQFRIAKR